MCSAAAEGEKKRVSGVTWCGGGAMRWGGVGWRVSTGRGQECQIHNPHQPLHRPIRSSSQVLVLMSDTGGGHRASAIALNDAFDQLYPGQIDTRIVDGGC